MATAAEVLDSSFPTYKYGERVVPKSPLVKSFYTPVAPAIPVETQATNYLNDQSEPTSTGDQAKLKVSPEATAAFGWSPNPLIQNLNIENARQHMIENQPKVAAVMKAAQPDATPKDRLEAANIFKSTSESRPEDVIRAVVNLNPADLYIALTGGSDRREIAIDANGKQYWKVYNARVSPANPAGELRRVEDFVTHQPLTPQQMDQVGPLTSRSDITAERQASFIAKGQNFKDVAAANSANYINLQKSGAAAATHANGIADLADQANELGQRLGKYSLPPAVLQQLTGVSSMRTGNTEAIKKAKENFNQYISGTKTADDFKNSTDQSGGVNFGLVYKEGQGLFFGNQKITSTDDLNRVAKNFEDSQSSTQAIERRRDDMLRSAQIAATAIDPANRQQALNDMTAFINKNAQIALMQNDIEKSGGVPGVKPNLPHALGESFQSGTLKAISDRAYGETANLWAQFINEKRAQLPPGGVPPMGQWEAEFANSPQVKEIKARAKADSLNYMKQAQAEMTSQSLASVPAGTPGAEKAPLVPPVITDTSPNAGPSPSGSKPPPPPKSNSNSKSNFVSKLQTPEEFARQTNADPNISKEVKASMIARYKSGYPDALAEERQTNKPKLSLSDIIKK